jgi:hypothetical protein
METMPAARCVRRCGFCAASWVGRCWSIEGRRRSAWTRTRCSVTPRGSKPPARPASRALELYQGDLLAGVFIADVSADFEHWLEEERRRLRQLAAAAAWSTVRTAELIGDLARAAVWARRGVELAPDDEASVRRLIRILDRKGDRAGALSVYEAFRARLAAEYDAVPSPETDALLATIRARQVQIWESPLSGWPPPGRGP